MAGRRRYVVWAQGGMKGLGCVVALLAIIGAVSVLMGGCGERVVYITVPAAEGAQNGVATTASFAQTTTSTLSKHERIQQEQAAQEQAPQEPSAADSAKTVSTESSTAPSPTTVPTTVTTIAPTPSTTAAPAWVLRDGTRLYSEEFDAMTAYMDAIEPLIEEQDRIGGGFVGWANAGLLDTELWKEVSTEITSRQEALREALDAMTVPPLAHEVHSAMTTAAFYCSEGMDSGSRSLVLSGMKSALDAKTLQKGWKYLLDNAHWE